MKTTTISEQVTYLADSVGGLIALSRKIQVDVGYLLLLKSGNNENPGDEMLAKLGLHRVEIYAATDNSQWLKSHRSLMVTK